MSQIKTGTKAKFAIGTVLATTNGTRAEYEADAYINVGRMQSIGEFGDAREIVQFVGLDTGRREKARGVADAGDMPITYADVTGDAGQAAIQAAYDVVSQAADEFNIRVQLNDLITTNPTTYYFRALVTEIKVQEITNDGVVLLKAMIAINTGVLKVAAA